MTLYKELENTKKYIDKNIIKIPEYITKNLKYSFFDWQKDAFENFLINEYGRKNNNITTPNHLMFNMATGTGKTLLMAALILYYYKEKGINKFIFFVNQNTIVGKTQSNFLEPSHNKYLFTENIEIDGKTVKIREVKQFADYTDDIQIKFTTIHKLHNAIYKESENEILLSKLFKQDIVLIGDEAHHLNATTARQDSFVDISIIGELKDGTREEIVEKSWETTVIYYLLNKENKVLDNKNVLLEFTATIPNDNSNIEQKYENIIISKFDLKDFVRAGFTKEIGLIPSNDDKKQRVLQALLFNWYRSQIALDYNIPNFKPVILFRSKTIEDSKNDMAFFFQLINDLKNSDFDFLTGIKIKGNEEYSYINRFAQILRIKEYIHRNNISIQNIILFLQREFCEKNCIITNSKTNTTQKEKTDSEIDKYLNSLEDSRNHFRAIFTVQRLTEGWDVLNLYDIVRMFEGGRDFYQDRTGRQVAGQSTTSEVQLIGRGVRYYPFSYNGLQKNKRKFDNNIEHELRCLEEFYFHSDNDERYISELINELRNKGLYNDERVEKQFLLKDEFKEIIKGMMLFANEQVINENRKLKTLEQIVFEINKSGFEYKLRAQGIFTKEISINFENDMEDTYLEVADNIVFHTLYITFDEFLCDKNIIYKAIHLLNVKNNSYFRFDTLKEKQDINSIDELLENIKNIKINITCEAGTKFEDLSNSEKLLCLVSFFEWLGNELQKYDNPYNGTDFELKPFEECFPEEKQNAPHLISMNNEIEKIENQNLERKLKNLDWYAISSFWGTSEERTFINFIENNLGDLKEKYDDVKLLRNEEVYKIYDFDHGWGFEPDFLLLLKMKGEKPNFLQVFIEPKGEHLLDKDKWKNDFLNQITEKYGLQKIVIKDFPQYRLIGLPFYNSEDSIVKSKFEEKFKTIL